MDKRAETELRLHKRGAEVEARFEEVHEALSAIRGDKGNVLRVEGASDEGGVSLQLADQPYRVLLEQIDEGAAACTSEGVVLFCNRRFADMLRMPLDRLVGTSLETLVVDDDRGDLAAILTGAGGGKVKARKREFTIRAGDGTTVPVHLSVNVLAVGEERFVCLVATGTTGDRETEEARETAHENPACRVGKRTSRSQSDVERRKGDVRARERAENALRSSEERLALAFRGTQEGIWDWNVETGAVWYSPRYKEMLGYGEDEIEPHVDAWKRLLHPDDRERVLEVAAAVLRGEREYEVEFRLRHKDGHYVDVLSRGFPVRREAGGPIVRIVGTHLDLTERKRVEEELRRTTEYLQNILDSSPDMIISVDRDRRIVEFNRAAETTLGYSRDEVIGQPVQMLYADPEEARHVYATMRKSGQFRGEIVNRTKTGETFVALLEASVLRDAQGDVLGVMGISRDITAQKRAEAERAALLAATERSHEDLLAILDQLRQGIVMTDREGRVTFVSQSCRGLLADSMDRACGSRWAELFPFVAEDKAALQAMADRPADQRTKVPVHLQTGEGRRHLMEVDILDDPRDSHRKIFFIYDLTEVHDLRRMVDEKSVFHGLVGRSQAIQGIVQQIRDLATADATVLIEGETGTGKELVAQAIHTAGIRSSKLFLPGNCAGLTESLVGSQLFGHKRGAFTGAFADHRGVFETAHGGTVFLDEIGDLPLSMQTNLLRVLQEKEITRLGESTPRKVDVRVIAATHHDLDQLVAEGRFRMDLLYRVRVARILIPPLRERRDDIPLLVERFLSEAARRNGKPVPSVSDEAMWRLWEYDWPGNVRELQSAIEFALLGCKGSVIEAGALPPELTVPRTCHRLSVNAEEDARNRLIAAIRAAKGRRTAAARLLGVSRATFYRRLQELHLDPDSLL